MCFDTVDARCKHEKKTWYGSKRGKKVSNARKVTNCTLIKFAVTVTTVGSFVDISLTKTVFTNL